MSSVKIKPGAEAKMSSGSSALSGGMMWTTSVRLGMKNYARERSARWKEVSRFCGGFVTKIP